VLIDGNGHPLLSRRVVNDELELAALIDGIRDRVTDLTWAIDLADGAAALVIALLLHRDQPVFHLPGSRSIGHRLATGVRAGPMPRTLRSSPTKPGSEATCASYGCLTMTLSGC
jgi:Transposase